MHHSAEAHFNVANKFDFALTTPNDKGMLAQNVDGYVGALNKSYSDAGAHFNEVVDMAEFGLTPQAAGAMTQGRAFSTVFQEPMENALTGKKNDNVLQAVLQPFVETYKKNLKPQPGEVPPVLAGRITK